MSKAKVVIIGGGGAGVLIAKLLSAKLNPATHELVVVNPRDVEVFYPALVRAVVTTEGNTQQGAQNAIDQVFANGNGSVKIGTVARVEPHADKGAGGRVVLASGETIDYAALVVAPGSLWEGPLAIPNAAADRDAHFDDWRARFKNAQHVVLVGGGAVGSEIAGELKDTYPNKKVTVVHGGNQLLNDAYPAKFRDVVTQQLRARGVELVLGDYIDTLPAAGQPATTRLGRKIDADLVAATRGGRPNTAFLKDTFALTESGHVKVEKTLEVKGFPGVFAAGDVLDWQEQKQAAKIPNHAAVVVHGVLDRLADREPSKKYAGSTEMIVITNGKNGGSGFFNVLWGITLGAWFARMIKSKDMLVGMHKKQLGFR